MLKYKYYYLTNIYKMEYGISCSPAQMRKLRSGGAVTLSPSNFNNMSPHRINVMPNTARRINTALKKMKGVRVALKPDEDLVAMTEGGAISLKSIGKSIDKGLSSAKKQVSKGANVVKKGFDKTIVDSGVGKEIAKNLIRVGTDVVLPMAAQEASMYLGDPTGMSGQILGNMAGQRLKAVAEKGGYGVRMGMRRQNMPRGARLAYDDIPTAERQAFLEGAGIFDTIKSGLKVGMKKVGKVAKDISKSPLVKEIGKVALREGANVAGQALTEYTGNPEAGMAFERLAVSGGDKLIETGNTKKALGATKKQAKEMAKEELGSFIDSNLTGVERDVAKRALSGHYASSGRMGKGLAHLTPAYSQAMRSMSYGGGFAVDDDRMITPSFPPSDIIQIGSPFQRINSPAMSPFIPSSPQLAGQMSMGRSGGSFYPAGSVGGAMGLSKSMSALVRKAGVKAERAGGSFLAAGTD